MSIEIKKITTKKEQKTFITFPWKLYRGKLGRNENWVPPLLVGEKDEQNIEKHPFFKHAEMDQFMAFKDGEAVGRIAGIIDRNYIDFHEDEAAFWGYFECIDDAEVAKVLFETVETWAKERGMKRMIGPMNPSTNHILGVLIDSFDIPPIVQMGYNPDYYPKLYEECNFLKEKDLYCYKMSKEGLALSDKITRVTELAKKRNNLTVRSLNMKDFKNEVDLIFDLYNAAWEKNWGFVPWTKDEFDLLAEDLKLIAEPKLVLMVFSGEKLAGISIPLPDINEILIKMNGRLLPFGIFRLLLGKKKVKMMRVAIMGVHPDFRNKGVDAIFVYETYKTGDRLGYQGAEFSWILEDNLPLRNMLETWGAGMYRTYRVYKKDLQ